MSNGMFVLLVGGRASAVAITQRQVQDGGAAGKSCVSRLYLGSGRVQCWAARARQRVLRVDGELRREESLW